MADPLAEAVEAVDSARRKVSEWIPDTPEPELATVKAEAQVAANDLASILGRAVSLRMDLQD